MELPDFKKNNSGLAGLIEKKENLAPNELLDNAKAKLSLTDNDLLFLSANYLEENIKMLKKQYSNPLMEIKSYKSKNYNEKEFEAYKSDLSYLEKAKLDFQILLNSITSEKLLRQYFRSIKHDRKDILEIMDKKNHAQLAISFLRQFSSLHRPNGRAIAAKEGAEIIINSEKIFGKAEYTIYLEELSGKEAGADFIINHALKNFYKNYFLNDPKLC
jgi:hypothetical protein